MPQQIRGNILTFQENPDFNWVLSLLELRLFVSFSSFWSNVVPFSPFNLCTVFASL